MIEENTEKQIEYIDSIAEDGARIQKAGFLLNEDTNSIKIASTKGISSYLDWAEIDKTKIIERTQLNIVSL